MKINNMFYFILIQQTSNLTFKKLKWEEKTPNYICLQKRIKLEFFFNQFKKENNTMHCLAKKHKYLTGPALCMI